jgi:hypothetical protein
MENESMDATYNLSGGFKPTMKRFADLDGPNFSRHRAGQPAPLQTTKSLLAKFGSALAAMAQCPAR